MKTYLPAYYAAYLLARYAGKNETEWIALLNEDALRSSGERQIQSILCGGRRYYDLWEVFQIISRHAIDIYFAQIAAESGGDRSESTHPYARISFDTSNPKDVGFVELVIQNRLHVNLKLTPDEARSLAVHLFSQADICSCQDFEASEYKDANETAEDAFNAALIEIGFTDEKNICETSEEAS
jgi:hypothetical protein